MTDEQKNDELKGDFELEKDGEIKPEVVSAKSEEHRHGFFNKKCKNCDKLEIQAGEFKAGWQRAVADYQNLKNEVDKMRSEWVRMSEQQILEDFIPVYDNFKKAFAHHPELNGVESDKKIKGWIDGIGFIMKQFEAVLKNHNVEEIKTVGEIFDPVMHEAVGEEQTDVDLPEHAIVREMEAGYIMRGKVIKVAKVIVAKQINN